MSSGTERYLNLIHACLRAALGSDRQGTDSLAVALPFVRHVAQLEPEGTAEPRTPAPADDVFRDGAGHTRPLYRGLALYALARLGRLPGAVADSFARDVRVSLSRFADEEAAPRASDGAATVRIAFDALALFMIGATEVDAATRVFQKLAARQQPDGPFLERTASDNPEPMWYHELALLHAVTSYGYHSGDASARAAALRAATYQAQQIQPDHASSHPLGLHAFLRSDEGTFLADMMLHAAGVQQPHTMDTVSLLLLADALDCMRNSNWRE